MLRMALKYPEFQKMHRSQFDYLIENEILYFEALILNERL